MTGQHVGRQSDSLDDNDAELRAAIRERVKIKPTGRRHSGGGTSGNGDPCPRPGHGKMQVLASGREWCPNQSHDMGEPRDSDEPWTDPRTLRSLRGDAAGDEGEPSDG